MRSLCYFVAATSLLLFGCARRPEGTPQGMQPEPKATVVVEARQVVPKTPSLQMHDISVSGPVVGMPAKSGTTQPVYIPSSSAEPSSSAATTGLHKLLASYPSVPQYLMAQTPQTTRTLIQIDSRQIGEGPTLSGLDVLEREDFRRLKGRKVGLLVNHSAIDKKGRHILDLLVGRPDVDMIKLFSPEHGLFGQVDTTTPDAKDEATGLMVHSLYTSKRSPGVKPHHPNPADLKGLDLVIVDMQDIGARFYTYCSYMAYMMEECGKLGIEVMVLDRPNPIGGLYVDGPLIDDDLVGMVTGYFKMPIAHGMTMGEMANMFNGENKLGCKLIVVPAENWTRDMFFDQTGLRWTNPSPNIQDLEAAIVYPGIGITESMVSMGRGTTEPFHLFGAPWIEKPQELCNLINSSGIEGVTLKPVDFTPTGTLARGHIGEGKLCKGARIVITDRKKLRAVELGIRVIDYLQDKYGKQMVTKDGGEAVPRYDVMVLRGAINAVTCARIRDRKPVGDTLKYIDTDVQKFLPVRAKYLIYSEAGHEKETPQS